MKRCILCHHRVWPWQRVGWIVGLAIWHSACWRLFWHARARQEVMDRLEAVR